MHWAWPVAQKTFDAAARQSYILEVSHIHLCDWRRSLIREYDSGCHMVH